MKFRSVRRYGRSLMRQAISKVLRPVAGYRKQWWSGIVVQFVFGLLVGALLGFAAKFDYETEVTAITKSYDAHKVNSANNARNRSALSNVWIDCVIFIHPRQKNKTKYVQALRDTYTKQCNGTTYVTNSKEIRTNFEEELQIAFVKTMKTQYHWDLYREILKYFAEHKKDEKPIWTVVGDEQTFIVMPNLRKILALYDPKQPLMFGRMSSTRSLLSYIFPMDHYTTIHPQGGIVYSSTALKSMTNNACSGWFAPTATERALIRCSNLMNVEIMDPTDQEGMHLFNSKNLKKLITQSNAALTKDEKQRAPCCSDRVISFGAMNYREHRLVDFVTTKIRVFGYQTLQHL